MDWPDNGQSSEKQNPMIVLEEVCLAKA